MRSAPVPTDGLRDRIARCSISFHVRRLELVRDLPGNGCGVEVRRFAPDVVGTVAAGVPHIDWMQHVMGLAPGHEALIPEIVEWYRGLGVRPRFEIEPVGNFELLADALHESGARQTGFIDALWARTAAPVVPAPADVDVRTVERGSRDATLFARVLLAGHDVPDDALREHWDGVALWPDEPDWTCYLAYVDGEPLGAAALAVDDGVGYLASASTLPHGRGRGCQQALIHRRLCDAASAGCEVTTSLATPGSISHRNLERSGLGVAHTQVFWTVIDP